MILEPSFWNYLVFFPYEDEQGYDGVHDGGIKCIKDNAPEWAKKAYVEYLNERKNLKEQNTKA
ncbi:MAG: hypothetical protein MR759_08825 [Ruminococcus sp.]|jgi:hypothetical protein|nr:hypothetical protein [Ruminococcus sp.]